MTTKWFELQFACWECSGETKPYASLEEVVHELAECTDYKPINIRFINPEGLPALYDRIEWSYCNLDDIEPSDYQIGGMLATEAYSYSDEGVEKVIFIFNKIGW